MPVDPLYGELDDREADVINLAGILYAALVGKMARCRSLDCACRSPRGPPATAPAAGARRRTAHPDAICERVLHKEASQHVLPIETALEIAAALSDFVATPRPADGWPSMSSEPTVAPVHRIRSRRTTTSPRRGTTHPQIPRRIPRPDPSTRDAENR